MRCQDIMKREVLCLEVNDTIRSAALKMRDHGIGFMPVCDDQRSVVGTITDRDICVRAVADGLSADTPVSECMSNEELCFCSPDADLAEAQRVMGREHKSRLLVLDDDMHLCGVISLSDLASFTDGAGASETLRRVSAREVHPH